MLITRDLIRIRYIIWKVRARCWLVGRLRARGASGRREVTGTAAAGTDVGGV